MSLTLQASTLAVAPKITSSFMGVGGTPPYTFGVRPGGAGGTVDVSTGVYTAPAALSPLPNFTTDVVFVTDSGNAVSALTVKICSPLQLLTDILQTYLGLADDQVFLWNQKIDVPGDNRLYIAIGVANVKTVGNTNATDGNGNSVQSINVRAILDVFVYSRNSLARDQKELVVMALRSQYAESQMEANSFLVSPNTTEWVNISEIDGAAIPYKFHMMMSIQYFVTKTMADPYFTHFSDSIATNP